MCGGGPGRPPECHGGRRNAWSWQWLGPGNTNGWVGRGVPGIVPTQYTPPRRHSRALLALPHTCSSPYTADATVWVPTGHRTYDSFESTKEILGVDNAQYHGAG